MRMSPVQQYNRKQPVFTSNERIVYNPLGVKLYENTTHFFREFNWEGFAKLLDSHFYSADKVNVYSLACSDGSEAYSLAIMLIKTLGLEKAQKFFPIIASDIDEEILSKAVNGFIEISSGDEDMARVMGINLSEFFDIGTESYYSNNLMVKLAKAKDVLKQAVTFKQGKLIQEINNVEPKNSVVMCRNVLPYLPGGQEKQFIKRLGARLGRNSLYILGNFDMQTANFTLALQRNGFIQTSIKYCYCKQRSLTTNP